MKLYEAGGNLHVFGIVKANKFGSRFKIVKYIEEQELISDFNK